MASFSDMLVYLRTREKLTQEQAASGMGISRSALANYEKGLRQPNFEIAEIIADFYNVNMDTIFGREFSGENQEPEMTEGDRMLFRALKGATEEEKKQAARIIEAMRH